MAAPDQPTLDQILAGLPDGWKPARRTLNTSEVKWQFAVMQDEVGRYRVRDGNGRETDCGEDLEFAIGLLRMQLRRFVGYHAHDLVFVHAGAVAHNGRAIVLPGHSFSGKSTLVTALVRAGAAYYSDEYAVFDRAGRLQPYREPVALRDETGLNRDLRSARDLGGVAGEAPVPVGLVAICTFRPGARWEPQSLSPAQGVLALLEHAVPVRERPEQTLAVLRRGVEHAEVLQGERGESEEAARSLLERL